MTGPRQALRIARLFLSYYLDLPLIAPTTCSIGITSRCNSRCQYCSTWDTQAESPDHDKQEIIELLGGLRDIGVREVILSGGEPLLRSDLVDIVSRCCSLGFLTRLITNGSILDHERAYDLACAGLARIAFSLDSLDPSTHREVRGLPLRPVLDAIEAMQRVRDESFPALRIAVYSVIHKCNIHDLLDLADFAESRSLESYFQPVQMEYGIRERIERLWPDSTEVSELELVLQQLIARKRSGQRVLNREDYLERIPRYFRERGIHPDRCFAGYLRVNIDKDLALRPCWMLPAVSSLKDRDIRAVWFSLEMRQARRSIRRGKCPGCLYPCHIEGSYSLGSRT